MAGARLGAEVDVFFSLADFAVPATRVRPGDVDITVEVIVSEPDELALDGRVVAQLRQASLAAGADVLAGDVLVIDCVDYRVRDPRRLTDGAMLVVLLQKV